MGAESWIGPDSIRAGTNRELSGSLIPRFDRKRPTLLASYAGQAGRFRIFEYFF